MTSKYFWCLLLIGALCVTVSTSVDAQGEEKIVSNGTVAGILVGAVAVVVIVAYVVVHESSKKRSITGCVTPGANGMTVTDEKDKHSYALSGNTADIKPGNRITLKGRKIKLKDSGKSLEWETTRISRDLGSCQPSA